MKNTRKNVPTSSVMYAASPRSCTGEPPRGCKGLSPLARGPKAGRSLTRSTKQGLNKRRHLASHPRPGHDQLDARGLRALPRLDVDVRVEPEHGRPAVGEQTGVDLAQIDYDHVRRAELGGPR